MPGAGIVDLKGLAQPGSEFVRLAFRIPGMLGASRKWLPEFGTACSTSSAIFAESPGTARHIASTIALVWAGAPAAAALAMAQACAGCSRAASLAARTAISGTVL